MWVKANNTVMDGNKHLPGEVFEVSDEDGRLLIELGAASEAAEPKDEAPKGVSAGKAKGKGR